eukprot:s1039_g11.t1
MANQCNTFFLIPYHGWYRYRHRYAFGLVFGHGIEVIAKCCHVFFVLLVFSSAILALVLQKAIAKFVSPFFDLSQRPTSEEGPCLDVVSKKDKAATTVLNENKRLKQELLSSQRKCAELEKLLQAQHQPQCNPDIMGSKLNQFSEQIMGMNVFAVPDGEAFKQQALQPQTSSDRMLTVAFGFDETQQRVTRSARQANANTDGEAGPLYCLSRLLQQSSLRTCVVKAMLVELEKRFAYSRVFAVPSRATNSSKFRACLAQLLFTPWDVSKSEDGQLPISEKMLNWKEVFQFFNGDLADEASWQHWCTGCCNDRQASLEKAGGRKLF